MSDSASAGSGDFAVWTGLKKDSGVSCSSADACADRSPGDIRWQNDGSAFEYHEDVWSVLGFRGTDALDTNFRMK